MQDKIFRVLLILSAVVIPIIGGGIVYSLTADASGAFEHFGFWNFIFSDDWVTTAGKEATEHFRSLPEHCLLQFLLC